MLRGRVCPGIGPASGYAIYRRGMCWIRKHIFPGGTLLPLTRITEVLTRQTGLGYTMPPVRLSARGWGEVIVGVTHSLLLIGYGSFLQTGDFFGLIPLLHSFPVFFSVLAAILLAGLPDRGADKKVGKKTLAVRLGPRTVIVLAGGCSLLSVLAVGPLLSAAILSPSMGGGWFFLCSGVHSLVLVTLLVRMIRRRAYDVRIDTVLQVALSHILWSVFFPLAVMWR